MPTRKIDRLLLIAIGRLRDWHDCFACMIMPVCDLMRIPYAVPTYSLRLLEAALLAANAARTRNGLAISLDDAPVCRGGSQMIKTVTAAAITIAALIATPAVADPVTFSGSGAVAKTAGRLTPTGSVPVGSELRFSFDFDPDEATLFEADEQDAFYDLPISNFRGSIGSYKLSLDPDPRFVPVVSIGRGFSFFGGNGTEPSLSLAFYLPRALSTVLAPAAPFVVSPGTRETLALYATFKSGDSTSLGIDQLRNPQNAPLLNFAYSANDPVRRQGGSLQGSYSGQFTAVSAVPEPATWGMIVLGFGLVGGVVRRRTRSSERALSACDVLPVFSSGLSECFPAL